MDTTASSSGGGCSADFRRKLSILTTVVAAVLLPGLGRSTLWQIDEGRISECAREMAESGDWLTPRIGGTPYGAYPPLPYWLMAASGKILGFNEFAMRLPAALAGIGLVAITGLLVGRLAGGRAGLLAALVLGTIPGFLQEVSTCRGGGLATLFAVLAFERFTAWTEGAPRALWTMYLAASLGILAKGPVALAVLGLGGLAWFGATGRWGLLAKMKWHIGLPSAALMVLPWYVLVARSNGADFLRDNLLMENVSAFVTGFRQKRPWYFYLYTLPPVALPWLVALPLAWPARRVRGMKIALLWTAGIFLFLTVSSAKRQSYLLLLCPSLAAAVGIALAAALEERPMLLRRGIAVLGILGAAGGTLLAVLPASTWTGKHIRELVDFLPAIGLASAVGLGVLAWTALRRNPTTTLGGIAATLAAAFLAAQWVVLPRLDVEGREGVAFCLRVAERIRTGEALHSLGPEETEGAVHFYVGRPIPRREPGPGLFIAADAAEPRLHSLGLRFETLDFVADTRGRRKLLLRILP